MNRLVCFATTYHERSIYEVPRYYILREELYVSSSTEVGSSSGSAEWHLCDVVLSTQHLCWRGRQRAASDDLMFPAASVVELGTRATAAAVAVSSSSSAFNAAAFRVSGADGRSVLLAATSAAQRNRWMRKFAVPRAAAATAGVVAAAAAAAAVAPASANAMDVERADRASLALARQLSQQDRDAAQRDAEAARQMDVDLAHALQTSDRAAAEEAERRRRAMRADVDFARSLQSRERLEEQEVARKRGQVQALRRRFEALAADERRQLLRSIVGDADLPGGAADVDLLIALHSSDGGSGGGGAAMALAASAAAAPPPPLPARPAALRRAVSTTSDELRERATAQARATWENIVRVCTASRTQFVDDSFRPSAASIFGGRASGPLAVGGARERGLRSVEAWQRPKDIVARGYRGGRRGGQHQQQRRQEYCLFRGDPDPGDIEQGALGDCYFLSALAVLAARPEMVRRLFLTVDDSGVGAYLIRLCKDGAWCTVLVDDTLPCTRSNTLAFSSGKRKQLWVPLLEKAWAKVHGSYAAIESGRVSEALAALTGAPCETLLMHAANKNKSSGSSAVGCAESDPDMFWMTLLSFCTAQFPMGASCGRRGGAVDFAAVGLQSEHAYSLLETRQISAYGSQVRLLKLRNPWGRVDWNGDWCEASPMWTPALRSECAAYEGGAAEGIMWIALDSFIRYFDTIDVCKVREHWPELRFSVPMVPLSGGVAAGARSGGSVKSVGRVPAIAIETFAPTDIEITLQQESLRGTRFGEIDHASLGVVIVQRIGDAASGELRFVGASRRATASHITCEETVPCGKFLVIPLIFGGRQERRRDEDEASAPCVHVGLHTSKAVEASEANVAPSAAARALAALVRTRGVPRELFPDCILFEFHDGGGVIISAENRLRRSRRFTVDLDCSKSANLLAARSALVTSDTIAQSRGQILSVLTSAETREGWTHSFALHCRQDGKRGEQHAPGVHAQGLFEPFDL